MARTKKTARTTEDICSQLNRDVSDVVRGLSPREQYRALKGAMARESRNIRRTAVADLSSKLGTGEGQINASRSILKTVTAKTFKSLRGFVVTVNHAGRGSLQGQYMGRNGLRPVALFTNYGTRPGHNQHHGITPRDFMGRAASQLQQAETNIAANLDRNIARTLAKHGF